MTSWDAAEPTPAPQPTPTAPTRRRRTLIAVGAIAGTVVVLTAGSVTANWWHDHQVQRRARAMQAAYVLYQQSGSYALNSQAGIATVGAGELAFQVCQARDYARQQAAAIGVNDPATMGHEHAVQMAQAVAGTSRTVSEQIAAILDTDVCDVNG